MELYQNIDSISDLEFVSPDIENDWWGRQIMKTLVVDYLVSYNCKYA